ncbi:hypothetical protein FPRO06_06241 [Fusarium proliferatum]|nr:hypothetical protein FPRO06_06241 [Fusarium proliferatum]
MTFGGTPWLFLNSRKAVHELLEKKAAIYSSRQNLPMANDVISGKKRFLFMPYGSDWRRTRKEMHLILNNTKSNLFEPYQDMESRALLYHYLNHPENWWEANARYANSIIMGVIYGRRSDLGDEDMANLLSNLAKSTRHGKFGDGGEMLFINQQEKFLERNTNGEFTEEESYWMAGTLIEAGSDTTRITLILILAAAVMYPDWVGRTQRQLDSVCGYKAERLPTFDDMAKLPLVKGVIKEGLRWKSSIVETGVPHALTKDDTFDGYRIAAGTVVTYNSWAISHLDYEEPERFYPERFLDDDLDVPTKGHVGFGAGRRVCVGNNVAWNNLLISVSRLLYCFDIEEVPGKPVDASRSFLIGRKPETKQAQVTNKTNTSSAITIPDDIWLQDGMFTTSNDSFLGDSPFSFSNPSPFCLDNEQMESTNARSEGDSAASKATDDRLAFISDPDLSGLPADDVGLLRQHGCLNVPPRHILDEFIREYFLHVHPMLPLMDESVFWEQYGQKTNKLSLFLIQAMLFASCSFVPESLTKELGFECPRLAAARFYQRAKLLYVFDIEPSAVDLARGALLLTFLPVSSGNDHPTPNSVWLTRAIQHAEGLGASHVRHINGPDTASLKRLWWCCIIRDRSISLGQRRCVQIPGEYPLPVEEDFSSEFNGSLVYTPHTKAQLFRIFRRLMEFCYTVVDLLQLMARHRSASRNLETVCADDRAILSRCRDDLSAWFSATGEEFLNLGHGGEQRHPSVIVYTNFIYIQYYTAKLLLHHQKLIFDVGLSDWAEFLPSTLVDEVRSATFRFIDHLSEPVRLGLARFLPISVAAFAAVPIAMHVFEARLGGHATENQRRLCILIEMLEAYQPRFEGIEPLGLLVRQTVSSVESGLTSQWKGCLRSWTDIIAYQPYQYLRCPSEISVASPSAVATIYQNSSPCLKGPWYNVFVPTISLHATRDKQEHTLRRKVWDRGLKAKAMRDYEPRIEKYTGLLMNQLQQRCGKPVDITDWCGFYGFDVMGDLAFGKSFNMLNDGVKHYYMELTQMSTLWGSPIGRASWLYLLIKDIPILNRQIVQFLKWLRKHVDQRTKNEPHLPDLFSWLLGAYKEQSVHTKQDDLNLLGDAHLIVVAGRHVSNSRYDTIRLTHLHSDTTSTTMTCALFELARHPYVYQKLQKEVDDFLKQGDSPHSHSALAKLKYLQAIIDETMRLYPAIPSGLQRITPRQGMEIEGTFIPGNTIIQTPTYTLNRDERCFVRPNDFIPERWTTQPDLVRDASAFAPFSIGRYSCAGKQLGLLEVRHVLTQIVSKFNIRLAPNQTVEAFQEGLADGFTLLCPKLEMVFETRIS